VTHEALRDSAKVYHNELKENIDNTGSPWGRSAEAQKSGEVVVEERLSGDWYHEKRVAEMDAMRVKATEVTRDVAIKSATALKTGAAALKDRAVDMNAKYKVVERASNAWGGLVSYFSAGESGGSDEIVGELGGSDEIMGEERQGGDLSHVLVVERGTQLKEEPLPSINPDVTTLQGDKTAAVTSPDTKQLGHAVDSKLEEANHEMMKPSESHAIGTTVSGFLEGSLDVPGINRDDSESDI